MTEKLVLQIINSRKDGCLVEIVQNPISSGLLDVELTSQSGNPVDAQTTPKDKLFDWIRSRVDY